VPAVPIGVAPEHVNVLLPRAQRLRRLPDLVGKAFKLVWSSGRREFVITTSLQVLQGVGVTAQLLLGKVVLESLLDGRDGDFSSVLPELGVLVGVTVLLSFAAAVLVEQSRVLGEVVARRAYDRVLDVAGAVELEAFESPDFFDRLRRAQVGGLTRPLRW
jgi:ATP-binding cassette subfamily B protein